MNSRSGWRWLPMIVAGLALLSGCATSSNSSFDLSGQPTDPFADNATATVLIFISNDCPLSNRYIPELHRLNEQYTGRGVRFWLMHADPSETSSDVREHAKQFHITIPELRDPHHVLAKLSHAEVTPSVAVFSPGKNLVYHGRIDDRVTRLGVERAQPGSRELAETLDALVNGRSVPLASAPAIGCFIPEAR